MHCRSGYDVLQFTVTWKLLKSYIISLWCQFIWCSFSLLWSWCQLLFELVAGLMSFAFSWTHVDSLGSFATVFQFGCHVLQFNLSTVFTALFWDCPERFCECLEHFGFIWTKVCWWSNDVAVKGSRKMALPYEKPLQLRIVTCCCFAVVSSWNLVLEFVLNLAWTVPELLCLGVLVQGVVNLCSSVLRCWACHVACQCNLCGLDSWSGVWSCFTWLCWSQTSEDQHRSERWEGHQCLWAAFINHYFQEANSKYSISDRMG